VIRNRHILEAPWLCAALPVAVAIVSSAALYEVARGGWPGETGVSALMFCERLRDTIIKQPANSWSNISFVVGGIWIGFLAMRDRSAAIANRSVDGNRMVGTNFYAALYASLAVLLGPGSVAMHGSTTTWGSYLDVISMFIWISFGIAYGTVRLADLLLSRFVAIYFALASLLSVCVVFEALPFGGVDATFGILVATMIALEVAIAYRRPDLVGDRRWLIASAALFLIAFAIWVPSRTDGPWCVPDSLIQGHAVWHLLDACAAVCIFLFYRSERALGGLQDAQHSA
jgi:hypothetical protein